MARARASASVEVAGVHSHIGSQVFEASSFARAVAVIAEAAAPFGVDEISFGGGLGVPYMAGESAPTITEWGEAVRGACRSAGVTARISAEPGRSIVAAAAVTLYTVGTIKHIKGVRTYVSVDGGMSDNPRPVLYGSGYEAFLPRAVDAPRDLAVSVVGKHCESGDMLIRDAFVPADLAVGDVLATPVTGAYGHSMGSNYNKVLRPPVVFVADGQSRCGCAPRDLRRPPGLRPSRPLSHLPSTGQPCPQGRAVRGDAVGCVAVPAGRGPRAGP